MKNVQEGNLVFYLDKKYTNVRFLILFFISYASYFCGFTHHLNSIVSAICDILYNLLRWSIFFEPFCSFWCFILLYKRACVLFCFLCCPVRAVKTRQSNLVSKIYRPHDAFLFPLQYLSSIYNAVSWKMSNALIYLFLSNGMK